MSDKSTNNYGTVSKIIHWLTALIVISLFVIGFYMGGIESPNFQYQVYSIHESFGLLVLALVFIRISWHLKNRKPKSLKTHKKWEVAISHATHAFLYLLMFAIPMSGWVMGAAGEYGVRFFGFNVPGIVSESESLHESAADLHEILVWVIIIILGLHIAGALKHHFIDKDRTLERMTWKNIGIIPIALLVILVGGAYIYIATQAIFGEPDAEHGKEHGKEDEEHSYSNTLPADSQFSKIFKSNITEWVIDKEKSSLRFEAKQYGQSFEGSFDFSGQVFFDPEKLDQSTVQINIDINSIKTGSVNRDQQAKSADWFDASSYPNAVFKAKHFLKGESDGSYIAKGYLILRGVTSPIELLFNLVIKEDGHGKAYSKMSAELKINRLDFGVGQGQWGMVNAVSDNVSVYIDLLTSGS